MSSNDPVFVSIHKGYYHLGIPVKGMPTPEPLPLCRMADIYLRRTEEWDYTKEAATKTARDIANVQHTAVVLYWSDILDGKLYPVKRVHPVKG